MKKIIVDQTHGRISIQNEKNEETFSCRINQKKNNSNAFSGISFISPADFEVEIKSEDEARHDLSYG